MAPGFWKVLERAIAEGVIRASEVVAHELEQNEKDGVEESLYRWARAQAGLFVPIDAPIQNAVKKILIKHPRLINPLKTKSGSGADPFIIALAENASCSVVTQETRNNSRANPKAPPKIPDVCDDMGIRCYNLVQLFAEEGWQI